LKFVVPFFNISGVRNVDTDGFEGFTSCGDFLFEFLPFGIEASLCPFLVVKNGHQTSVVP
jgi:hypothetical protein